MRPLAASAMAVLAVLALVVVAELTIVGRLQHRSAQLGAFDHFREQLAKGTAPIGPTDSKGVVLAPGAPVAIVAIPRIHVSEVVGEGTTSTVLMDGAGHRRDTVLPGQEGTSVVYGRASAYGGPFKHLHELHAGDEIEVTTGQGNSTYEVTGLRRGGEPSPAAPAAGEGRLVLLTAAGFPYIPSGVLRVDAKLTSKAFTAPATRGGPLTNAETPLAIDDSTVWALVLWLQALAAISIAAVWSWHRWGHVQTWIVFVPTTALAALNAADELLRLLPNVL